MYHGFFQESGFDLDAYFARVDHRDPKTGAIEKYFTKDELAEMGELEKCRLRNVMRNYAVRIALGGYCECEKGRLHNVKRANYAIDDD